MHFRVGVGQLVFERASQLFGVERTSTGCPSEFDFTSGPLAAAVAAFEAFDEQLEVMGSSIRSATLADPVFGALTFVAVCSWGRGG